MFNIIHPLLHSSNMHNAPAAIHSLNRLFQPIPTILRKESSKNTIICSFITLMQLSTSTNNTIAHRSFLRWLSTFLFSSLSSPLLLRFTTIAPPAPPKNPKMHRAAFAPCLMHTPPLTARLCILHCCKI